MLLLLLLLLGLQQWTISQ